MPHFKSERSLLDAMPPPDDYLQTRKPSGMTKAQERAWYPMAAYKWDCGCYGMPVRRERGDYIITSACDEHVNLVGDFEESPEFE